MRAWPVIFLILIAVGIAQTAPTASPPERVRAEWHVGPLECSSGAASVSDGVITPGEYSESYFDSSTKILLYLTCDESPDRLMHVGIVSPWTGWVGFRLQASEAQDGSFNEVRISYSSSSGILNISDAFWNMLDGTTTPDSILGGSFNVMAPSAGSLYASRVYEFTLPLNSTDEYDCQLQSTGPYTFVLGYDAESLDLSVGPTDISEIESLVIGAFGSPPSWTTLEFAISPSAELGSSLMLVSLRDSSSYPIAHAQIEIFVRAAFGLFHVGPVNTNEQGVAAVYYAPRDSGNYLVGAAFTGESELLASVSWRVLKVSSPSEGGDLSLGLVDGSVFELQPIEALIVVTVGGVWAAYGYALFMTRRLMRKYRKDPSLRVSSDSEWERRI